jgi:exodeoxyribonuclease VII large subunit
VSMDANPNEVISVAELDRLLSRTVQQATAKLWVGGEVSSLRRVASGHVYFVLKDEDEDAMIDCVVYRSAAPRALRHLSDGARVQLSGRAVVWAPRGRLQFVAETVRPSGRGELLARLEALKERLAAEGLFDAGRKRRLPAEPRCVGVVTSRQGAAFHDIVSVSFGRGNVRIVLSAAMVQGELAPEGIVRALDRLERLPGIDVIIVGRGGGASEDLMAFNDERVVRRVAASTVPIVSAVGHEIDATLTDLAADVRASTPSHAAELVMPDHYDRERAIKLSLGHLMHAMQARIAEDRAITMQLRQRLSDPRFVLAARQQLVDDYRMRLERQASRSVGRRQVTLTAFERRLGAMHPRLSVARGRGQLEPLFIRLRASSLGRLSKARARLEQLAGELDALSPLAVLGRGYAIVMRPGGEVLYRAAEASVGEALGVRLHEGSLRVRVEGVRDAEGEPR